MTPFCPCNPPPAPRRLVSKLSSSHLSPAKLSDPSALRAHLLSTVSHERWLPQQCTSGLFPRRVGCNRNGTPVPLVRKTGWMLCWWSVCECLSSHQELLLGTIRATGRHESPIEWSSDNSTTLLESFASLKLREKFWKLAKAAIKGSAICRNRWLPTEGLKDESISPDQHNWSHYRGQLIVPLRNTRFQIKS